MEEIMLGRRMRKKVRRMVEAGVERVQGMMVWLLLEVLLDYPDEKAASGKASSSVEQGHGKVQNSGKSGKFKTIKVQHPADVSKGVSTVAKDKQNIRKSIVELEEIRGDCKKMVERVDEIVTMKKSIVEKIDNVYAESSSLIKKQKLLLVFSQEIETIFKHFLTNERVFYFNNLLKISSSETLSRSNVDTILE